MSLTGEEILSRLVALNAERAREEKAGAKCGGWKGSPATLAAFDSIFFSLSSSSEPSCARAVRRAHSLPKRRGL